jgi:flagellar protein FlaG
MIIQKTTHTNPAEPPDIRASGPAPKPVADTSIHDTPQQPSSEQLKNAVNVINKVMQLSNHSLEFSVDTDTKMTVVKMVDTQTGELIRQFPSEATLAISRQIDQYQQGLLLTHKA